METSVLRAGSGRQWVWLCRHPGIAPHTSGFGKEKWQCVTRKEHGLLKNPNPEVVHLHD
jgi:hypothetical protein